MQRFTILPYRVREIALGAALALCALGTTGCESAAGPAPGLAAVAERTPAAAGTAPGEIVLCQALEPVAACSSCNEACGRSWSSSCQWECIRSCQWQRYAQGEYVGSARTAHVPEYRLRVDDELDLVYRLTREEQPDPYKLNVGDEIRLESFTDPQLDRELLIQPDGTITLRLLGQVKATGRTIAQLRDELEKLYQEYYKVPAITVTPLKVNSKLEDLRASVDRRYGEGGQNRPARITPEGTIALPVLGSVPAQGLTLRELQQELNERYRAYIEGIEVVPVLLQRAPRYVYVLGEVGTPGRFELTGPTTLLQAISMAGSWRVGAKLHHVVVFRRDENWCLMGTVVDIEEALRGKDPCPAGEIWLNDSDVVVVPKSQIQEANDFVDQVFTRGIYGALPFSTSVSFSNAASL
jgi:polysaccharide export outer membrane protein